MDPKDIFEQRSRLGLGPMEPAGPRRTGLFESVEEAIFERSAIPIKDALPRAIEFRRKTESWFSFPYHCLMNVEYHPHDQVVLGFSTHRVEIRGRNLESLYKGIQAQSCERVAEADRAAVLTAAESDPEIASIDVYELEWGEVVSVPAPESAERGNSDNQHDIESSS